MLQVISIAPEELRYFAHLLPAGFAQPEPEELVYGAVLVDEEAPETGVPIGALLARVEQSELKLEYLYVDPEHRRNGVARTMVEELCTDCRSAVLLERLTAVVSDRNQAALELLSACGFTFTDLGRRYTFPLSALKGDFWDKPAEEKGVYPLAQLPETVRKGLDLQLEQLDAVVPDLPLQPEDYDGELSLCALDEKGEAEALLLVRTEGEDISLDYLYARSGETGAMVKLLRQAACLAARRFPADQPVTLTAVSQTAERLAERLLPEARRGAVRLGTYEMNWEVTGHEW